MKLPGLLRLEYALVKHSRVIVATLAVVALLSLAGLTVATIAPPTHEVQEEVNPQTVTTTVNHQAVVTSNSSLWETGTVLEDRQFYPLGGASNLQLEIRTTTERAARLYGDHHLSIVYYSKVNGNRIWERTHHAEPMNTTYTDDAIVSRVTLPVSDIFDQMDDYNDKLTGVGTTDVELRLQVNYSTLVYSGGYSTGTSLQLSKSGYQIGGSLDGKETRSLTVTETEQTPPDRSTVVGVLAIVVLCAVGAGGTRWISANKDPATIKVQIDRQRCSEWISEGWIRQPIGGQDVMMMSLEDLVYVAIDSKERVIHDPDRELYAIMDDGMFYYYDPMEDPAEHGIGSEAVVGTDTDAATKTTDPSSDDSGGTPPSDAAQISIDEADTRAWNQLLEEEGDSMKEHSFAEDSSEATDDEEPESRAWDQLMDGGN